MKISKKISAAAVATPTTTTEEIKEYEFPFLIIPFTTFASFSLCMIHIGMVLKLYK